MMNTFRLSVQPSSHYLGQLDVTAIKLKSTGYGERAFEFPAAVATIGDANDERRFDIVFDAGNGIIDEQSIEIVQSVLSQVAEMDEAARSLDPYIVDGKELDHDEVLARIVIVGDEARFRYFATTLNTEWDVVFERQPNQNWLCRGIASPK